MKHAYARYVVSNTINRCKSGGKVSYIIANSGNGLEEKLKLVVLTKVHKTLSLPEMVQTGA